MLLKYFYDKALAHASYMVGCQKSGEAVIIDASRDIEQYFKAAAREEMTIIGAVETHIHADFVAGSRELAERAGAKLFLSDEGPKEWKYEYASQYDHQLLKDSDEFYVGKVKLTAVHTPGHTPEHMSFLLTDEGGGASEPMGIFTGDFVFVNAVGRPDLLETAAGQSGSAKESAKSLFQSVQKFKQLPERLQIWPAHGAGSSCGKGLGSIPSSTVGYEKLVNPAMQYENEQEFVDYILDEQPETPDYFKIMKRVNKEGPNLLADHPAGGMLGLKRLQDAVDDGKLVIDTRHEKLFAEGHVPGTILIPMSKIGVWSGWFIDYEKPVFLISGKYDRTEAIRVLQKIGVDTIEGTFDADGVEQAGLNSETFVNVKPREIADGVADGEYHLIDVRSQSEWNNGHIPQAKHQFLGKLDEHAASMSSDKPVLVQCRTGIRSSIGASILQAQGTKNVVNLDGGFQAWKEANLPVDEMEPEPAGAES